MQQHAVNEHHLGKVCSAEADAAQQRHAKLFPDDAKNVGKLHLVQAQRANDRNACLRAAVAAGAGEHGNECIENQAGGKRGLIMAQNDAGEGRGKHQDQKPRDTRFPGFQNTGFQIGLVRRQHGRHFFKVLRGLFFHDVDRVVDGDDADKTVFRVHHGHGDEVVPGELLGDVLFIVERVDGHHVGVHDLLHDVALVREQERADGHDAEKVALLVRHIADVDRFHLLALTADPLERVLHRHGALEIEELRGHQGPRAVLGIFQNFIDALARVGVGVLQNTLDDIGGHLLHDIDGIVEIQLVEHFLQLRIGKAADQHFLRLRLQLDEHLRRRSLRKEAEDDRHLFFAQILKERGDIRGLHLNEKVAQMRVLFSDDHLLNLLKQLVAAVFKIDHIPDSSFPAKCSKKTHSPA